MGLSDLFRKKSLQETIAEKEAYRAEKERIAKAKQDRRIEQAKQRGRESARPLGEKIKSVGSAISKDAGGFINSPGFQNFARAGSSLSGGYSSTKRRAGKRKSKGKKKTTGKRKKSRRSRQPRSFFDMVI